jgi:hypothetical protein
MGKQTRALSGASKDAFIRRIVKEFPELPEALRPRLIRALQESIASLRVRTSNEDDEVVEAPAAMTSVPAAPSTPAKPAFDPYAPNIIVVIRKLGRDHALNALSHIESADNLRLLAREQQLSIDAELSALPDICEAIVAAAERRIANRLAAAG